MLHVSSIYAQTTVIPDAAFEQALIDLGIDSDGVINGSVATADVVDVISLNIDTWGIDNLTGIEDFTNLIELYCFDNRLTSLDMNHNTNLQVLVCWGNKLTSLDISQNTNLQMLDCSYNLLTNLDISQNYLLRELICESNQISKLDLGQNLELDLIYCSGNQLSSLEVSHLSKLEVLDCSDNQISYLDLSNATTLRSLECIFNNLQSLNIKNGNNSNLTFFDAINNPLLTCIQVDDEDAVNSGEYPYTIWSKDAIAIYSEDCTTLGVNEVLSQTTSLYPNPVTDMLTIDSEIPLTKIEIYSIIGKKVKDVYTNFNSILFGNLSYGVYIVKIYAQNGFISIKIIKI